MEDSDIIKLYWHRSETAILETKKKYHKLCSHIADNILHSREDSEECVQDTYLAVWNRIPEERPHYFRAFVCKITRNISFFPSKEMPSCRFRIFVISNGSFTGKSIPDGSMRI